MSRRTSHTYDITINKENNDPFGGTDNSDCFKKNTMYEDATDEYRSACELKEMMMEDLNGHLV
jgi:hypothetical protein